MRIPDHPAGVAAAIAMSRKELDAYGEWKDAKATAQEGEVIS